MTPHWYTPLESLASRGSRAARPGSLAALAARRKQTLSQFFTPSELVALMWRIATPAMQAALARTPGSRIGLLDTACGSGRLFQFATPDAHELAGCDIDPVAIGALTDAAEAAGFACDLAPVGLETIAPRNHGVAVLNPPFSIALDSPQLAPLPSTHWGRFGPNSAAISHAYAVDQGLAAADIVVVILPTAYANERVGAASADEAARLRAVLRLPRGSFRAENTQVDTTLLVYGPPRTAQAPIVRTLATLDEALPDFDLHCRNTHESRPAPLRPVTVAASRPVITLPVTGDRRVRIGHSGRKLAMRFSCGLVQAQCLNSVLVEPVTRPTEKHRYPKGVAFRGQGKLDLECYLAQPDPLQAFDAFVATLRDLGAAPEVDPGLRRHLAKRARLRARQAVPFHHAAPGADAAPAAGDQITATASKARQFNPKRWGSAVIPAGSVHTFTFTGDRYRLEHATTGEVLELEEPEFLAGFTPDRATDPHAWGVLHAGRLVAFPQLAHQHRTALRAAGADRISTWAYQLDDVIEVMLGRDATVTWEQGCGKTRAAMLLALLAGKHTLVALEPYLVEEMCEQLREVGWDPSEYQVITRPEHCDRLRKLNLISIYRLKGPVCPGAGRRTYASRLRRRCSLAIVDEADFLRKFDSDQSRAVWRLSPRRRVAMTGTPVNNFVRDLLGIAQWVNGDGVAHQPYGRHHAHLTPALLGSMNHAATGTDHYLATHAIHEWITHEFAHSGMQTGAKRELPRIRNLEQMRQWAAPLFCRRRVAEPAVCRYFRSPDHEVVERFVDFDRDHLRYYLRIADEFRQWWVDARRKALATHTNVSLVAILARIGVVQRAATFPQTGVEPFGAYHPLTSKQRAVLDRLETWTKQGHKSICYVDSPANVERFVRELAQRGIEAVPHHGEMPIAARTKLRQSRFVKGPAPVLLATLGTCQKGLNLFCASRVAFVCRNWSPRAERQAMKRVLRPQQTRKVLIELWHIAGSLDEYMAQVSNHKGDSADAVVDLLDPVFDDAEYLHLDAILDRFVAECSERAGMTQHEFRERIKQGDLAHVA